MGFVLIKFGDLYKMNIEDKRVKNKNKGQMEAKITDLLNVFLLRSINEQIYCRDLREFNFDTCFSSEDASEK